jgi:hypothetical protein
LKWALAIEAAVCCGGGGSLSSRSGKGFPFNVERLTNCDEEDLRDVDDREGVVDPTPCREFMDAFRSSVGVAARASRLREEELRRRGRGLRADLPFGEELFDGRWPRREGECACGEDGRAVDAAALVESRCREDCKALLLLLLFMLGGSGAGEMASRRSFDDKDDAMTGN